MRPVCWAGCAGFGRIVAMMQFNMYHHYTADEHLLRAIGLLSEVEQGKATEEHPIAFELLSSGEINAMSFISRFCCMISPRGDPKTIRLPVRALRGGLGLGWVYKS